MAAPQRSNTKIGQSSQEMENQGFDEKYNVPVAELLVENSTQDALLRWPANAAGVPRVVAEGITMSGDIEIGAVELKDDDSDTRLPIGAITALSGTTSTSGDILLAVAPGFKVKLYHVSYVPTTSASVDINVSILIGANTISGWRTNFNGGGYMRSPKGGQSWWEGADGEDITITLSAAQPLRWNLEYDIVAV